MTANRSESSAPSARPKVLGWVAAALGMAMFAIATPASAQFDKYGHYNQNAEAFKDICAGAGGSKACGPVAFLNSLVFLQNTYGRFGNTLTGDDPATTVKKISEYMGCTACSGTDTTKFYAGKTAYLRDVAPGQIQSKKYTNPLVDELMEEMRHGEDVELYFGYYDSTGAYVDGHYVTLTEINDNWISFVDPGGVGWENGGAIDGATDEAVEYTFDETLKQIVIRGYDGAPAGTHARIDFAFAESPIPEPATWAVMVLGFGLLGASVRLRREARV